MNKNELRRIIADELALSRELKRDDYATASKIIDAMEDVGAFDGVEE